MDAPCQLSPDYRHLDEVVLDTVAELGCCSEPSLRLLRLCCFEIGLLGNRLSEVYQPIARCSLPAGQSMRAAFRQNSYSIVCIGGTLPAW